MAHGDILELCNSSSLEDADAMVQRAQLTVISGELVHTDLGSVSQHHRNPGRSAYHAERPSAISPGVYDMF